MADDIETVNTLLAAGELAVATLQAWPTRWADAASREVIGYEQMIRANSLLALHHRLNLTRR